MGRRPAYRLACLLRFDQSRADRKGEDLPTKRSLSWESDDDDDEHMLTATTPRADREKSASSTKSVRFGDCSVRTYRQVLGEHPYCSRGCPLELGWEYQNLESKSIADIESNRESTGRRCGLDLRMTPEERHSILQQEYSEADLRRACRRLNRDGRQQEKRIQREFFNV